MMLQFTTGSVEDRQKFDVLVGVMNAGIQPANVLCLLKIFHQGELDSIIEQQTKLQPKEESIILEVEELKDVRCGLVLKVDSPSLIVTIKSETRYPLKCQTIVTTDIDAPQDSTPAEHRSTALLWGYAAKGDPF